MHPLEERATHDAVDRLVEDLRKSPVRIVDEPAVSDEVDPAGRRVGDQPEPLFALVERALHVAQGRHVATEQRVVRDIAARAAVRYHCALELDRPSVERGQHEVAGPRARGLERDTQLALERVPSRGRNEIGYSDVAQRVEVGQGEPSTRGRICVSQAEIGIGDEDPLVERGGGLGETRDSLSAATFAQIFERREVTGQRASVTAHRSRAEARGALAGAVAQDPALEVDRVVAVIASGECMRDTRAIVDVYRFEPTVTERLLVREAEQLEQRVVDEHRAEPVLDAEHTNRGPGRRHEAGVGVGAGARAGEPNDRENARGLRLRRRQRFDLHVDDDALVIGAGRARRARESCDRVARPRGRTRAAPGRLRVRSRLREARRDGRRCRTRCRPRRSRSRRRARRSGRRVRATPRPHGCSACPYRHSSQARGLSGRPRSLPHRSCASPRRPPRAARSWLPGCHRSTPCPGRGRSRMARALPIPHASSAPPRSSSPRSVTAFGTIP